MYQLTIRQPGNLLGLVLQREIDDEEAEIIRRTLDLTKLLDGQGRDLFGEYIESGIDYLENEPAWRIVTDEGVVRYNEAIANDAPLGAGESVEASRG